MKCPLCGKKMTVTRKDRSSNLKEGAEYKEYHRTTYWCDKDDIWINIEIPTDIALE